MRKRRGLEHFTETPTVEDSITKTNGLKLIKPKRPPCQFWFYYRLFFAVSMIFFMIFERSSLAELTRHKTSTDAVKTYTPLTVLLGVIFISINSQNLFPSSKRCIM